MVEIFPAYRKAIKVIESSETLEHMEGARNFINNFFRAYSVHYEVRKRKFGWENLNSETKVEIRTPNTIAAHMYEELLIALESKEAKFQ